MVVLFIWGDVMTLEEIKTYLRVDGTDDDTLISSLMLAAANYINGMTGKTKVMVGKVEGNIMADELYILTNKLIIAHWYENRGVEIPGNLTKISHSIDALVNHISMCGDYV